MLAAMIDGLVESGARAAPARPAYAATSRGRTTAATGTAPTSPRCCRSWRCAGATSACCCRCRARGSATPRSPRSPTTSSTSGSRACGPAMAITEPGTGSDSANIRTTAVLDGDEYVLNGEKIYVTAGERCDARRRLGDASTGRWAGRRSSRSWSRRARPGMKRRAARAQARHPRLRHRGDPSSRTAGSRRRTSSARPRSTPSRASPARWRPSTTPARWSPRWRSAAPGPRLDLTRELLEEAGVVSTTTARADPVRRRRASSCSWRPTGRPPTC